MKRLGMIALLLALFACKENTPEAQMFYITPDCSEIVTDYTGIRARIPVTANCEWSISGAMQWCLAEKVSADGKTYLDVEILPNETETPRETTLLLSYSRTTSPVFISQDGFKAQTDPLPWSPLAVNTLTRAEYEVLGDNVTRRYRITGNKLFVTPSFKKQVFPGNLIDRRTDNMKLTDYRSKYTFNPVHFSAYVNREFYEKEVAPSFEATDEMAQQIIAKLPKQSQSLSIPAPIQYHSYRHLNLLGRGNMGLSLNELITGRPYAEKEMQKPTGVIYTCALELFSILMDNPEKLIQESTEGEEFSDMLYINSVGYGKTAVLLVESDDDFVAVKSVMNAMIWGWELTAEQLEVRDRLDVWYIYFDKFGAHTTRGNHTLIERCTAETADLSAGIIPLSFTTTKLKENSVGNMEVGFDLP